MSEAFSEERLVQLDERWRRDPSSRIFVQLAEEYRRAGRLAEAITVLEQGLQSHPSYLSALVALGRCRLESGDPARAVEVLEQAVVHDPAQLVANKLLVEAYLRTNRAGKARERLDFYRLFNQRDAEIEALERRIGEAVPGPVSTPPSAVAPPAAVAPAPEAPLARAADIFDLRHPAAPPLGLTAPPLRPAAPRPGEPFGLLREPFDARRRIARALAAGGLFPMPVPPPAAALAPVPAAIEEGAPVEPVEAPVAAVAEPLAPLAPEPVAPPWGAAPRSAELELEARAEIVAAPFSPRTIGEEVERETIEEPFDEVYEAGAAASALPQPLPEEPPAPIRFPVAAPRAEPVAAPPEPVAAPPEPVAVAPEPERVAAPPVQAVPPAEPSATLGELFLAQGHLDEAEQEFRAVLARRPAEPSARAGLAEIARRRPASAQPPEAPAPEAARATGAGLTRRKIDTLRGYLDRLRRASGGARVS